MEQPGFQERTHDAWIKKIEFRMLHFAPEKVRLSTQSKALARQEQVISMRRFELLFEPGPVKKTPGLPIRAD